MLRPIPCEQKYLNNNNNNNNNNIAHKSPKSRNSLNLNCVAGLISPKAHNHNIS